ncbi:MAG: hypothetical protein CSB13_01865 [Chloroflexi bacterium]|nr:MAG: hypothetical protein CSB13_01865 [Chloroflexota bacterium]
MYQEKENEKKRKLNGVGVITEKGQHTKTPSLRSRLQHSLGNQQIQRLYQSGRIQTKLEIEENDDPYERQADEVADRVLHTKNLAHPASLIDNKPLHEIKPCNRPSTPLADSLSNKITSLQGGQQLSPLQRDFYESRLGADLSRVRLHTNDKASALAESIQAKAFTLNQDIVFAKEHYQPHTQQGRHLIAHELTHVLQQTCGNGKTTIQRKKDDKRAHELIPTATLKFTPDGVWFIAPAEATFKRGRTAPQLLKIALKALLKDEFPDALISPLMERLYSRKFAHTRHFEKNTKAGKEEKITKFAIMFNAFIFIIDYLQSKNLTLQLSNEQLKNLHKAYSKGKLFADIVRISKQEKISLPRWYSREFFDWQLSAYSQLHANYQQRLLKYEETIGAVSKKTAFATVGELFRKIHSEAVVLEKMRKRTLSVAGKLFRKIYSEAALLEAIRKDVQLYINPETQLAYQAIWHLTPKQQKSNKPAQEFRSIKNASKLVSFARKHKDLACGAKSCRKERVELLKKYLNEVNIEKKSLKVLPPYPAFITSPDLNPDHTTVKTASNTFRMLINRKEVHGRGLLHQTVIAMAEDIYYSWRIYHLPESLKSLRGIPPDDLRERTNDFVKNSPGNLKKPVKEYGPDRNDKQSVDMEKLGIGDYLLMGIAAPQYRKDMHWVQRHSTAGHPLFVCDATTLANKATHAERDQLNRLKQQYKKASSGEERTAIGKSIELIEKRESSGLLALTKKNISDTNKLIEASTKLKRFIEDDKNKKTSRGGNASTGSFIMRLLEFDQTLSGVYVMILRNYSLRPYQDIKAINFYIKVLEKQRAELERLSGRISHLTRKAFKKGFPKYRVIATLVKKKDGNVVPLMLVAGYHPDADPTKHNYKIKIVDVTVNAKKDHMIYVGDSADNEKEAVDKAFIEFGKRSKYGNGKIAYRLPQMNCIRQDLI